MLVTLPRDALVLVACSGGADSLALAEAAAFEAPRAGLRAGAVVVDHGLQAASAEVAEHAAAQCRTLGLSPVEVVRVQVQPGPEGPEAAARAARYAALEEAAARLGAAQVLLGHTRDDQAEQVLLGLARGSGTRSLSGMPRGRGIFARPLLDLPRAETVAACAAKGLEPWADPHNEDPAFARVRARTLLAQLARELGPGVTAALARSADQLREDADYLDNVADEALAAVGDGPWEPDSLTRFPRAIRTRLWRRLAIRAGAPAGSLTAAHIDACDALLTAWRGQGPVSLPGPLLAARQNGRVSIVPRPQVE